jgi:chromosome segregation ATPase
MATTTRRKGTGTVMVSYNYNRSRYSQPSTYTRLREMQEALMGANTKLDKALAQIKALESEVSRLERELANRG